MVNSLFDLYKISMESETGVSYLVLELPKKDSPVLHKFQIEMLSNNPISSIIPFEIRRKNEDVFLYYNIAFRISLSDYLRRKRVTKREFIDILIKFANVLLEAKNLLLHERNFIFNQDYIFVEPLSGQICFMYLPVRLEFDHGFTLKECVMNLITRSTSIEILGEDNYLQKIIDKINSPDLSTENFKLLLSEIKNVDVVEQFEKNISEQQEIRIPYTTKNQNEQILDALFSKNSDEESSSTKAVIDFSTKIWGIELQTILVGTLSQIMIVILAIIIEGVMKSFKLASDTRYITVGLFVLVTDFLLFKLIFQKRAGVESGEDNPDIAYPVNTANNEGDLKKISVKEVRNKECVSEVVSKSVYSPMENDSNASKMENIAEINSAPTQIISEQTVLLCKDTLKRAFLIYIKGNDTIEHEVDKNSYLIGRNTEMCDLVIENNTVGRIHAEILRKDGKYLLRDKNSKNGCYVNDELITGDGEYELKDGDVILFSNVEFKFVIRS